jgi:O-antigen/teichoic acid export membrane protein
MGGPPGVVGTGEEQEYGRQPKSPANGATMAIKDILKAHRTWEDGVALMLGIMIGLSPWFYDEPAVPVVVLNSGLIGLAVLALAQLELIRLRRWEEIAQLACGIYLFASPFIFQYAHQHHLRLWHWALGAAVSILALFELWQDSQSPNKS